MTSEPLTVDELERQKVLYSECHANGCQPQYDAKLGNSYCKVCRHWIHPGPPKATREPK